ncbi:MAG: LysM peptidoglycan-binding domain-containing protein [Melioribacteraceae bacterium]|nr:MAG: LysM peptidoglycan-binding domain-containing protein [Melioribacteraceae bacterium]
MGEIAERYGVKISDIQNWNNLSGNKILAGNTLKIYSDANINDIPTETKTTLKSSKNNNQVYTVKKGESLFSIAQRYNTSVAKLKSLNNLKSNNIQAGQKLLVN